MYRYMRAILPQLPIDYSPWRAASKLKKPTLSQSAVTMENNKWARRDLEKAKTFARYLKSVFTPRYIEPRISITEKVF